MCIVGENYSWPPVTILYTLEPVEKAHNPNSWIGECVSTYSELAGFSENTRSVKSASFCGSNVEGTMMYSPAGSRMRELTSRRLMKSSERALDALDRKKSRFRWTPDFPTNWAQTHSVNSVTPALTNLSRKSVYKHFHEHNSSITLMLKSILNLQNSEWYLPV